jgi:hypothetical protein
MRWWGGYIEENAGGGCQISHQLCRNRERWLQARREKEGHIYTHYRIFGII